MSIPIITKKKNLLIIYLMHYINMQKLVIKIMHKQQQSK